MKETADIKVEEYTYKTYDRPGLYLTPDQKAALTESLRALGRESLSPLPDYQVFSSAPSNLDDKIIITAHTSIPSSSAKRLVAFTSAHTLEIPGFDNPVVNAGLTVVSADVRAQGFLVQLFINLFAVLRRRFSGQKIWLISVAEVPKSLVLFSQFVADVYPSPHYPHAAPTAEHLFIARAVSEAHRDKMLISPQAVWDEENFVMRGSNLSEEGKCFMKDVDDRRYWHRDMKANDFYRKRFRKMMGDEVLQVGWIDDEWLGKQITKKRFEGHQLAGAFKVRFCVSLVVFFW